MGSTTTGASAITTPQRQTRKPQLGSLASSPILQADELSLNPRWSPHIKSPRQNTTISSRIRLQNSGLSGNGDAPATDNAAEAAMRGGAGPLASPLSKRARILQTNSPESLPPLSPVVSARKRSLRAELAQDTPFPFSPTASGLRIRYAPSSPLSPTLRSTPNRNEPESPTLTRMLGTDSPSLSLDEKLGGPTAIDDESPTVSQMSRSLLFRLDIESPTGRRASAASATDRSPLLDGDKPSFAEASALLLRRSPQIPPSEDDLEAADRGAHSSAEEESWSCKQTAAKARRPSTSSRSDTVAGKLERKRRRLVASRTSVVPQIYVSPLHPRTDHEVEKSIAQQLERIRRHFDSSFGAREADFVGVTAECGLPRFANRALFQFVARSSSGAAQSVLSGSAVIGKRSRQAPDRESWPAFEHFCHVWAQLRRSSTDVHSLLFNILVEDAARPRPFLVRDDLRVLVADVLDHHSELEFLEGQDHYAQSYMETVIERIFYVANRSWDGCVTLAQFRKADVAGIIRGIEDGIDIDIQAPGVFSYKHFYVLFCSFFELDSNRDRLLDARDLLRYFNGMLSRRTISRIMMGKGKPSEHAASRPGAGDAKAKAKAERRRARGSSRYDLNVRLSDCRMTYRDFIWFLLSEIDKTTPTAVEYWFRCLDLDGDGVLTIYELEYFYDEQVSRMEEEMAGDMIMLDDLMCQLSDLVRPEREGLFTLKDLRHVAPAQLPVFFDAFTNLTRFVEHETRTSFLQRQLAQLSMRALPTTSFEDVIQIRMDFLASIPNAWIEFADLEYAALLNDHHEYDETTRQPAEDAAPV
ncbi:Serine/threonine-protein phosphatase 2A regulatory subunit B'' subunit alpha [Coemansia sp. RSA 1813]|nr:Serine/threonine-protein phosphatase 2A regulatory subunit B'' subunit alpha [Coemansia sp. RSA 1646]KAJ1769353.1 Serine/threonine-protein phosphatase 2A regulatory subunit B'' subunit alpha [Coemansia sp. RSA 1843]KAJ2087733.1 Serine/threonine-protein phosphatase 2A regulatory subunit B'' subunit alpha [Coemansia sp. RSA 986]KAJ2213078.1 Serine/threonine-protein phosphatase 2A regulatory subunit B'' subunit alpha [Coemansia sp. RSA 487]KAJ2567226.1 Serine/threonine-protein phosphatase 2A re